MGDYTNNLEGRVVARDDWAGIKSIVLYGQAGSDCGLAATPSLGALSESLGRSRDV